MKIEFVKETKVNGESFYFTNIDGRFVNGSLSYKQDEAKNIYNNLVKNKGKFDIKETLESVEIEVAE